MRTIVPTAQASDDIESSEEKTSSGDEESSRDIRDTRDEDDNPCPCQFVQETSLVDDLDFFKSYSWGKEYFDLTVMYLKNKINLKKQSEVYNERVNASYVMYGFPWAFLVWIYEAFSHLDKYAKKSLDSPLPIPRLHK
ncbi:hypothetical protein KY285_012068 [Solanum tuberosum]|nr:hypothetical protein KY285_012068 [Solanum tuberosum]